MKPSLLPCAGAFVLCACGSNEPSSYLTSPPQPDSGSVLDSGPDAGAGGSSGEGGGQDAGDGSAGDGLPAFPGAKGWAAGTPGGRGGRIIRVTTLATNGPGSLVDAITQTGPRIIVFEVGGVIDLARGRLNIHSPFVTIAGQTAPSPGISVIRGGIGVRTHDVVIQHLRVRPGEASMPKTSGWETDSIGTDDGAYNVIVDHCSTTWGTDENLSASGDRFTGATADDWRNATSHVITFSNNIVAEGLSNSTHSEGEHSKGGLIHDNVTRIAIVDNLYFSNMDRHPLFKGGARGVVVNNYVANPGEWAMRYTLNANEWGTHPPELGQMAIVGNVFIPGPSTPADVPLLRVTGIGQVEVHLADNIAETSAGADAELVGGSAEYATVMTTPPIWPEGLTAVPAAEVAERIRANVGARPWDRDAIDTRIVEQALGGEGAIIDSEQDVGGYPTHAEARAPFVEDEWDLNFMIRKTDGGS